MTTWPVGVPYGNIPDGHVLNAMLSDNVVFSTAFEKLGQTLHASLRAEHAMWRHLIGWVMLFKKGLGIRTAV